MRKIVVVGTCGAGKSSLAKSISKHLNVPHIELDELHWAENWTEVADDIFRQRVAKRVGSDCWIVDGNYSAVRDLVWSHADTVIWLDYSFPVVMTRLFNRTMSRIINRTETWHGNKETWQMQFFNRDSILWWGISTYVRRRQEYLALLKSKEYQHINFVRFQRPAEAEVWLNQLAKNQEGDGFAFRRTN